MTIAKKIIGDNKKSWDSKIKFALWVNRIRKKSATWKYSFELVYGLDVTLPIHLKIPVYQLLQAFSTDQNAVQNRLDQLIELDEKQRKAFNHSLKSQNKVKRAFDKSSRQRDFQVGDSREKPGKHGKFDNLWTGPYLLHSIAGTNSFNLGHIDGERLPLPVNGQLLKLFFNADIWCLSDILL